MILYENDDLRNSQEIKNNQQIQRVDIANNTGTINPNHKYPIENDIDVVQNNLRSSAIES